MCLCCCLRATFFLLSRRARTLARSPTRPLVCWSAREPVSPKRELVGDELCVRACVAKTTIDLPLQAPRAPMNSALTRRRPVATRKCIELWLVIARARQCFVLMLLLLSSPLLMLLLCGAHVIYWSVAIIMLNKLLRGCTCRRGQLSRASIVAARGLCARFDQRSWRAALLFFVVVVCGGDGCGELVWRRAHKTQCTFDDARAATQLSGFARLSRAHIVHMNARRKL